jgi:hypothetical protein
MNMTILRAKITGAGGMSQRYFSSTATPATPESGNLAGKTKNASDEAYIALPSVVLQNVGQSRCIFLNRLKRPNLVMVRHSKKENLDHSAPY